MKRLDIVVGILFRVELNDDLFSSVELLSSQFYIRFGKDSTSTDDITKQCSPRVNAGTSTALLVSENVIRSQALQLL